MAATSVTGKGLGSADKKNKGSEHMTLGVSKLIGPRFVYADQVTLDSSGDLTVILPELPEAADKYIVMASDAHASAAAAVAAAMTVATGVTTLTLKGPNDGVVNVFIARRGLSL